MLRQSAIYFASNMISALTGVAWVGAITRLMEPREYGVYVVNTGLAWIISSLLFSWLRLSILRFQGEDPDRDVRASAAAGALLTLGALPFVYLALANAGPNPGAAVALATLGYVVTSAFFDIGQEVLRARQKPRQYMNAAVIRSLGSLALGVSAALVWSGAVPLLIASALSYLLAALMMLRPTWLEGRAPFRAAQLADLMRFGGPLTLGAVVTAIYLGLDRFVLSHVWGSDSAGQFAAAADFTRQSMILSCAGVFAAVMPATVRTFELHGREEAMRQLGLAAELILAVVLPAAIGFASVSPYLAPLIFGPKFAPVAAEVMPALAIAWAMHLIWQQYIHLSFHLARKPRLVVLHGAILLLVATCLVVPATITWGARGTAGALIAAEAAGLGFGVYLTRFACQIPLWNPRFLRIGAAGLFMALVTQSIGRLLPEHGLGPLLAIVGAGTLAYGVAALALDIAHVRTKVGAALARNRTNAPGTPVNPG